MSQMIQDQLFEFIVMVFCGIGMVLLRHLYKAYRNRYSPKKSISFIQEMLFWFIAAILVSFCLYYACFGAITVQGVLGFTIGALLWYNIWHAYR